MDQERFQGKYILRKGSVTLREMEMVKHPCIAVAETLVYGGAHKPTLEDRRYQLMMISRCLQIGVDRFASAAWPMKVAPWDQKVTISRTWLALKRLMEGLIMREEALPLAFVAVEAAAVMEALV